MNKIVGEILRERNLTIACAESCTGGLLTSKLTDIAGSSDYLQGSIVSYSNEIKISALNVDKNILEKFGAVSPQVAIEMAKNIREIFNTDIGVGVTGIAGPGGGSRDKPIGLVFIAVADKDSVNVEKFNFAGTRIEIKNLTAESALKMIKIFLN